MIYKLRFKKSAEKEWARLDHSVKQLFKKKLGKIIENPKVEADRLRGGIGYKIKLRSSGFRLIYTVDDNILTIEVIAIGKRDLENNTVEVARRDTLEKQTVSQEDVVKVVSDLLDEMNGENLKKHLYFFYLSLFLLHF